MKNIKRLTLFYIFFFYAQLVYSLDFAGNVGIEYGMYEGDDKIFLHHQNASVFADIKTDKQWSDGNDLLTIHIFSRQGDLDDERNHSDIRELSWVHAKNAWQYSVGISKIYWGIAESQQLVDTVNQTDFIEDINGDVKLGQPLISISRQLDTGSIELLVLPGFRYRTFPGEDGRFRLPLLINADNPDYESNKEERHIDYAFRYQGSFDALEYAVSGFKGTSRDPSFHLESNLTLTPYYPQVTQFGLELEYMAGDWIWKLETIQREGQGDGFVAATAGFEYTLYGVLDTDANLTMYTEYLYDEREDNFNDSIFVSGASDGSTTPVFENDLFLGFGINFNDASSGSEPDILLTTSYDAKTGSQIYNVEANRSLGKEVKLQLKAMAFQKFETNNYFSLIDKEYFLKLSLVKYF